jgi:hypothetical protein
MDIRAELESIVNINQGVKENDYEYVVRLAETVDREATDDTFEALSKEAKDWMNKAITSYKTKQKLPELPGVKVYAATAKAAPVDPKHPAKPLSPSVNAVLNTLASLDQTKLKKALSPAPAVTEELNKTIIADLVSELTPPVEVETEKVDEGASSVIREIICQNYNMPLSGIQAILKEKNIPFKPSLVRNVLAYVGSTIKTLDSLGLLKNSSLKGQSDSAKLRELICSNPTFTVAQIKNLVTEKGINCNKNTISVMYYHIKATRLTLKKLGMVD